MRVLGLIPARGRSKGVPRKNIRLLCGKPLLQYTAEAALQAGRLNRVILSTEDAEIAEIGLRLGLDVPFMRPDMLAMDDTPMLSVIQHVLRTLDERGDMYDAVCLLQPTTPLRNAGHINACIGMFEENDVDCVFSMLPVPHSFNPHWVYFQHKDTTLYLSTGETSPIPRRQSLPPAYYREGSIYVSRAQVIMENNSLYGAHVMGYLMNSEESVNIDSAADWDRAEKLLQKQNATE